MDRTLPGIAPLTAILTISCILFPSARAADEVADKKPAVVVVRLPAEAELTVSGLESKQKSAVREFDTPPLPPGKKFSYTIKAKWKDGDKDVERETKIVVRAGETTEVNLLEIKPPVLVAEKIPAPELMPEIEVKPKPEPKPEPKPKPEKKPESPLPQRTIALLLPETLTLSPGSTKLLPIKVVRTNCQESILVSFKGVPPGVVLNDTTIPADKEKVYVLVTAAADSPEKEAEIRALGVSGSLQHEFTLKIKVAK